MKLFVYLPFVFNLRVVNKIKKIRGLKKTVLYRVQNQKKYGTAREFANYE